MRVGQIASPVPLSVNFGCDRGTPIDRLYIEQFLASHAADIRGHVLEVGDDGYSRRFGSDRVAQRDVLTLHPGNPAATIVGDITDPATLPSDQFDCIILTQTLQYVFDVPKAMQQVRRALRARGILLLTVPAIIPDCPEEWQASEDCLYWKFTCSSVKRLLEGAFDRAKIEVRACGNLYAATAFLHGASVQEAIKAKLQPVEPTYAITITARAVA
jgi:SAM-dependent methyltransferase